MNLAATSYCPPYDDFRGSLYNVTRGYDSASLFTDPCGYGYGNWKTINYTNLQYPWAPGAYQQNCPVDPTVLPDGELGIFWGMVPWGTGNPAATPLFSFPDDVTLVNSSWQTCTAISYGVWDPPMKLTKETAMVPAAPTLSQQLIATPRSPIPTPYGPATVIPSVEDPKTDASRLLPPIPSANTDPNSPTGDSSFSSSNPPDNARLSEDPSNDDPASDAPSATFPSARLSEDPSNDDPASDAPSATFPSSQIYQPAQRIKGSASSLLATPVVNTQSPTPGPTPGPRLSLQPDIEDARFALSLVAPIVMPQSTTVGGQIMAANSESISLPANTFISGQSGIDVAGSPDELDISSQLVIGAPTIGSTTIPLSAVSSGIFTVGGQGFTAKSNAIFMKGERIASGGQGSGTQVSLGSSGLLDVGSSTIFVSAEQALPTVFTVGSEVFTPNPTAISMDGTTITAGGPGVIIAGTSVDLQASGSLVIGNSTFAVIPTNLALPTVFTVGSEVFTPNPTAISMDGTTITAGGPGVIIAGTSVDLQASGSLVIGNSTFAVISTNLCTSPTNLIFEGQATNRRRNMFVCVVYIVTICIVLAAL